jgi:hypothetical protein
VAGTSYLKSGKFRNGINKKRPRVVEASIVCNGEKPSTGEPAEAHA